MVKPTVVIDTHANHEEVVQRMAKHLGKGAIRRAVFNFIYGRMKSPKPIDEIMTGAEIPESKRQQVRNALNYLSKHNMISKTRIPKPGSSKAQTDGFGKIGFASANKREIIKLADNPAAAKMIPTKRSSPSQLVQLSRKASSERKKGSVRGTKAVLLYLIASPADEVKLRVDAEVRYVQAEIRGAKLRDKVDLQVRPAADLKSLIDGLNDLQPSILHFSGHGDEGGLAGDDGSILDGSSSEIDYETLRDALSAVDRPPRLVVLNACKTASGKDIVGEATQAVITMSSSVTDLAAANFSTGFYAALAGGQSLHSAFSQGTLRLKQVAPNESMTPVLTVADGINPKELILVN